MGVGVRYGGLPAVVRDDDEGPVTDVPAGG
jgi:hypothetical protein